MLTDSEQRELEDLEDSLISKIDKPDLSTYKGCTKPNMDPDRVARMRTLRMKKAE